MRTIKYLSLLILIVLISCKDKSNPVSSEVNYDYFYNSWKHSYEEDIINDPTKVFRPSDYKVFPATWYRETFIFRKDNTCSYLVLGPSDIHYFQDGKWNLVDKEKNIITLLDSTNTIYKKFQINELKRDILKIKFVN